MIAWEIHKCFEHAEHEGSLLKSDSAPFRPPNSLLLPEEEKRVIAWIGDYQQQGNCPCPRKVRDFGAVRFQVKTRQGRFFTRDWMRGVRRRPEDELTGNTTTAKKPQSARVPSKSALNYIDIRQPEGSASKLRKFQSDSEYGRNGAIGAATERQETKDCIFEDVPHNTVSSLGEEC
jgi:hypothetical protein